MDGVSNDQYENVITLSIEHLKNDAEGFRQFPMGISPGISPAFLVRQSYYGGGNLVLLRWVEPTSISYLRFILPISGALRSLLAHAISRGKLVT